MAKSKKSGKRTTTAKVATSKLVAESPTTVTASVKKDESAPAKLMRVTLTSYSSLAWNRWLAALHVVQGLAILLLSATHLLPVTTNYLTTDSIQSAVAGHSVLASATRHLFDVNLAYVVAAFFFVSAIARLAAATVCRERYEADLKKGVHKLRWLDFALSTSIMLVAMGFLGGITDLSALIMIFSLGLVAGVAPLAMEAYSQNLRAPNWLSCSVSCVVGIVPWIVFAVYAWGAHAYGGHLPGYVYGVYISLFVLFAGFAANMWLQFKKQGRWADNVYGERMYMILSLVAQTALAWQIFAGVLRP
jgi:uncharacterized membrane protein